jgi:hypothetical protein
MQEPAPWQCIGAEEGAKLAKILGVTFKEIVMNNDLGKEFVSLVKELRRQTIQPVAVGSLLSSTPTPPATVPERDHPHRSRQLLVAV